MTAEIFLYMWIGSGLLAAFTMFRAQGDWVLAMLCGIFGPAGLGVSLVEYARSRGF